jgi:hypothetical protein
MWAHDLAKAQRRIFKAGGGRKIQVLKEGNSKPEDAESELFSFAIQAFSMAYGHPLIESLDPQRLGRFRLVGASACNRLRRRLRCFSPVQAGDDGVDLGEQPLLRLFVIGRFG